MSKVNEGFIKIHRSFMDWEWYTDTKTKTVFLHCILAANWKEGKFKGRTIPRGSFVSSYPQLAQQTELSIKSIRTALNHLKETGEVAVESTSQYSIITVVNYDLYQDDGRQNGRQRADEGQAKGRQRATIEEKKEREEKQEGKNKNTIGPFFPNDEILNNAFMEFLKMRKQIKKPMGDHAIKLAIKKLETLSGGDNDLAIKIINQSILGSWQGFYPLKDETKNRNKDNDIVSAWKNA